MQVGCMKSGDEGGMRVLITAEHVRQLGARLLNHMKQICCVWFDTRGSEISGAAPIYVLLVSSTHLINLFGMRDLHGGEVDDYIILGCEAVWNCW